MPARNDFEPINNNKKDRIDSPFAWVVVVGSFTIHLVILGSYYGFGVLFVAFLEEFPERSRMEVALVGSICQGIFCFSGQPVGVFIRKYGERTSSYIGSLMFAVTFCCSSFITNFWFLYVTQGFLLGISFALSYVPCNVIVSKYHLKNRALAIAFSVAGSGVGTFVMSPLTESLVTTIGWRWALRILGLGGGFLIFLSASTFIPISSAELSRASIIEPINTSSLIRLPAMVVMLVSMFFLGFGYATPYVLLVDFGEFAGMSPMDAAWLLSYTGIGSLIGRILSGILTNRKNANYALWFASQALIMGIFSIIMALFRQEWYFIFYSFFYGGLAGSIIALIPIILADIVGLQNLSVAFGLLMTVQGISQMSGPPIAGWLRDSTKDFTISFLFSGSTVTICGLILFYLLILNRRDKCVDSDCPDVELAPTEKENQIIGFPQKNNKNATVHPSS